MATFKETYGTDDISNAAKSLHHERVQARIDAHGARMQSQFKTVCQLCEEQEIIQAAYAEQGE